MPGDEYISVTRGTLKLKGVKDSKVEKKKKKKKKTEEESDDARAEIRPAREQSGTLDAKNAASGKDEGEVEQEKDLISSSMVGKTAAERRHEEMRRKRLDERLKREGSKTHKERVEELNKYLSNLSEHHDMPRIGPG